MIIDVTLAFSTRNKSQTVFNIWVHNEKLQHKDHLLPTAIKLLKAQIPYPELNRWERSGRTSITLFF